MRVKRGLPPRSGASAPEHGDERARHAPARTPSWGRVLMSTGRVWLGRHMPSRTVRRVGAVAVAVLVVVAGAGIVLGTRSADPDAHAAGVDPDTAARTAATKWITTEVRQGTRMACDKAMCAQLRSSGVAGSDLLQLTGDGTELAGTQLVVASPDVRKRFGTELAFRIAPDVLGIFGQGPSRVEVRQRNTHSRAGHDKIKAREQHLRQRAALQLLDQPHVHTSSTAMHELAAGEVDNRLVYALARIARYHTINVTAFGGRGPFTGIDVPERTVDIDQVDGGAAIADNPAIAGVLKLVRGQRGSYQLAGTRLIASGENGGVLRLHVTAPTPEGLLPKGLPVVRKAHPSAKQKARSTKKPAKKRTSASPGRSAAGSGTIASPTPSGRS